MSGDPRHPFFEPRKRAAPTGTAFDSIRVGVPCPQCGKKDLQPLAELVANDATECQFCGFTIDLHAEGRHVELLQLADEYKQIKPAR